MVSQGCLVVAQLMVGLDFSKPEFYSEHLYSILHGEASGWSYISLVYNMYNSFQLSISWLEDSSALRLSVNLNGSCGDIYFLALVPARGLDIHPIRSIRSGVLILDVDLAFSLKIVV